MEQFSKSTIDDAVNYAFRNQNNIDHMFATKHNLSPLINTFGGRREAVQAVLNSANGQLPSSGVFNTVINAGGHNVTITGIVQNGAIKLSNMWIP